MESEHDFIPEVSDTGDAEHAKSWEELLAEKVAAQEEMINAEMAAMTELFEKRYPLFRPDDLTPDSDGGFKTFDEKIRNVFPEVSESHLPAMRAAVTMELCMQEPSYYR